MEQIRSSVNLPFHSFLGIEEQSKLATEEATKVSQISHPEEPAPAVAIELTSEDIIMLEENSNKEESNDGGGSPKPSGASSGDSPVCYTSETNKGDNEETMSLSDLSTSFQKSTQSFKVKESKERSGSLQIKPFDYEAARKQVKFGVDTQEEPGSK